MKLDYFETTNRHHYQACVWKDGNEELLDEAFTTKKEAINAVKKFRKHYDGELTDLNCYVREFDEDGCAICDYDVKDD